MTHVKFVYYFQKVFVEVIESRTFVNVHYSGNIMFTETTSTENQKLLCFIFEDNMFFFCFSPYIRTCSLT